MGFWRELARTLSRRYPQQEALIGVVLALCLAAPMTASARPPLAISATLTCPAGVVCSRVAVREDERSQQGGDYSEAVRHRAAPS